MLLRSKGIVLQTIQYGDNAFISKVFTEEKGLITIISYFSKKNKSRLKNQLSPLCVIELVCMQKKGTNIYRSKEISLSQLQSFSFENIATNSLRFFLAEFLSKTIQEEEENRELYSFLEYSMEELYRSDTVDSSFHLRFLINYFSFLGIQPQLNSDDCFFDFLEGSSTQQKPLHEQYCEQEDYLLFFQANRGKFSLNKSQRSILLSAIINYYNAQIGGGLEKMKSRDVLEELFS